MEIGGHDKQLRANSRSSSHITSSIRGSQISGMTSPLVRALWPSVGLVGRAGGEGRAGRGSASKVCTDWLSRLVTRPADRLRRGHVAARLARVPWEDDGQVENVLPRSVICVRLTMMNQFRASTAG